MGVELCTRQIVRISHFHPILRPCRPYRCDMEDTVADRLREAGDELRANHDDAVIADVIGEVERLEGEDAEITANLLRFMVESPA